MSEEIPADFMYELEALVADDTPVEIVSTRWRLWCLMSAVQLASRHPYAMQTAPMQVAVAMARAIQGMVATTPALARIAEQGWDAAHDIWRGESDS
jgi:hypothetical protein